MTSGLNLQCSHGLVTGTIAQDYEEIWVAEIEWWCQSGSFWKPLCAFRFREQANEWSSRWGVDQARPRARVRHYRLAE